VPNALIALAALAVPRHQEAQHNDGLALAGINGTILAIIVAASLGYLFIIFQALDALVGRYVERANRATDLRYRINVAAIAFPADRLSFDDLLTAAAILGWGHPGPLNSLGVVTSCRFLTLPTLQGVVRS
jgi:hypothetical protein